MNIKLGLLAIVLVVVTMAYAHSLNTKVKLMTAQLKQAQTEQMATMVAMSRLQRQYNANATAMGKLQTQLQTAQQNLQHRSAQWETLKRENKELKIWADTLLPDPAIRLHQRPAFTGPCDYSQWLSRFDAVLSTGQQSSDEQRSEPRHQEP